MSAYQIFLCSSINEFEKERRLLDRYVQKLNPLAQQRYGTCLYLHKCEKMNNALTTQGLQALYNEDICRSNLVVFLFGERAGEFTLEELKCAAKHFGDVRHDRICVMCRQDPYHTDEPAMKQLMQVLDEYQLPWLPFHHLDSVKLAIMERLLEQL